MVVEKRGAEIDRECVLLPASQILQDSVNLFFFAESLKERQQVQELCVIHIVKPGLDRDLGRGENQQQLDFNTQTLLDKITTMLTQRLKLID